MTDQPQSLGGTEISCVNALTERIIGCAIEVHRVASRRASDGGRRPVPPLRLLTREGQPNEMFGIASLGWPHHVCTVTPMALSSEPASVPSRGLDRSHAGTNIVGARCLD